MTSVLDATARSQERRHTAMNMYLDELIVRERLEEARAHSAERGLLRSIHVHRPVREVLGMALIRIGHWVAGRTSRRAPAPRRAIA
jgi:hypothetical protein